MKMITKIVRGNFDNYCICWTMGRTMATIRVNYYCVKGVVNSWWVWNRSWSSSIPKSDEMRNEE